MSADAFVELPRNVVVFARVLRSFGLGAPPDRAILFARSLETIGLASRSDVKAAAQCMFVRKPEEAKIFVAAFDAFWRARDAAPRADNARDDLEGPARAPEGRPSPRVDEPMQTPRELVVRAEARSSAAAADGPPAIFGERAFQDGDRSFTYSFAEGLYHKDLSQLTGDEIARARELTQRQAWDLGRRLTRRSKRGRGRDLFDARRTLRSSLRRGGEVFTLHTRARRLTQRDIVLLCDVSGSMDRYSRLLLQFVHTVRHAVGRVEAFVFGTRLTRITREIRHRNVADALNDVSRSVVDWAGGTRIGECLRTFNHVWARRVLGRGAIVLIVSDGWDRGDVDLLGREMQRLQRSAYRLVWLNPLLGSPTFRPQTVGMQAALPYIDDFLPAHNLKNLVQLAALLRTVEHHRPARPQSSAPKPPAVR